VDRQQALLSPRSEHRELDQAGLDEIDPIRRIARAVDGLVSINVNTGDVPRLAGHGLSQAVLERID